MRSLSIAVLVLMLSACNEQVEETYGTWAEAKRAGAIDRGWVPGFVPESARNLSESHNLDTNAQTLRFVTPPSDVQAMVAELRAVSTEDRGSATELARRLGFESASEVYVVCSDILNGALIVDRQSGRSVYETPANWADDDCSQAR